METASLKSLAIKALKRNQKGNHTETIDKGNGNLMETGTVNNLSKMPLSVFRKEGSVLKVWSDILNEHVYFVSSDTCINKTLDAVAYTASELREMLNMSPEELKAVHEVKAVFHKGRVIEHKGKRQNV